MRFTTFAATALIATAATGIAAATGYAEPPAPAAPGQVQTQHTSSVQGQDHGVNYVTTIANSGKSVVTTVTGGKFNLNTANNTVVLTNGQNQVVMQYPLTAQAAGKTSQIAAAIDNAGARLTLTPQGGAVAQVQNISGQDWFFSELQHAALGAAVGAVIGVLVGFFFLGIGFIPGALIGAVIGLLVAGGQPLIDSGFAYFSGH
jgi:hypothetical protein